MIEAYSFGRMTIDGREYTKDLKIFSGRVKAKWWRKKGHFVDEQDLQDLIEAKPRVLVIGTGAHGLMKISPSLKRSLANEGIELIAQPSADAVDTFNRLQGGEHGIAAAFHLTC